MCTLEKRGNIFILTLTGPDEHCLNPNLFNSLISSLREAKSQSTNGSVLITTSKGSRFFSNGLDLAWASNSKQRFNHLLRLVDDVLKELITLPMPTIAAVNGHAAAGGAILALAHDYVLMRGDKGVLYMSEVDLGLEFPKSVMALFRDKVGSASARRDLLLGGKKVRGEEAMRMGAVDGVFDGEMELEKAVFGLAEKLGGRGWDGNVYKEIRMSLCREVCRELGLVGGEEIPAKL